MLCAALDYSKQQGHRVTTTMLRRGWPLPPGVVLVAECVCTSTCLCVSRRSLTLSHLGNLHLGWYQAGHSVAAVCWRRPPTPMKLPLGQRSRHIGHTDRA